MKFVSVTAKGTVIYGHLSGLSVCVLLFFRNILAKSGLLLFVRTKLAWVFMCVSLANKVNICIL